MNAQTLLRFAVIDTDADAPSLPISEVFVSIQGEGKLTGTPSLFIRVSGCNLRCKWCDTPYASWNPTTDGQGGGQRSIDDLIGEARGVREKGVRHAVLTGGEPMMFRGLCELSARLAMPFAEGGAAMHITVETAGTTIPKAGRWAPVCNLMSISPKLASSTPRDDVRDPGNIWSARHEERRIKMDVLRDLLAGWPGSAVGIAGGRDRQLKFVASADGDSFARDLEEIDTLLKALPLVEPDDVLLMPEGIAPPSAAHKANTIAACLKRGWRYCPRLHIELFGNRRGT